MTDQQKGYGLGIIIGIRLPCLGKMLRHRASPSDTERYRAIPSDAERCRAMPSDTERHQETPSNIEQHRAISSDTERPATRHFPPLSIRISPLHTYDEINLIKVNTVYIENNTGELFYRSVLVERGGRGSLVCLGSKSVSMGTWGVALALELSWAWACGTRHTLPVRARPYTPRRERLVAHSLSVPKQKATKDCNADDSRSGHSEGM
ncbi:hypothetical protein KGM_214142 [Danaus plexippus plexippus]|uniref:Uncharacterized protein n=1 Tax=Danaus plexippus plexippus TaxID=278856 RepID=A0A212FPN7_DANPL|nr:hypothetical protein KGM_214142 [Danaus plexippus plexippus]